MAGMRASRTLSRYVVREVGLFTALGLATLVPLMVGRNLFQVLDDLVTADLASGDLWLLVRCVAAMLSPYALPIAFLLGALLAVGRMAADREVTALRACGLGLRSLLVPVLALGAGISGLTGYLMLEVEHRAQRELRARVHELATRGTLLAPGAARRLGERTLFVRERRPDGELGGVIVSDRSNPDRPMLVVAERGRLEPDAGSRQLRFRLGDGDIHFPRGTDAPGQRIAFETFDYAFPADALFAADPSRLRPREMPMPELRAIVERARAGDPLSGYRKRNPAAYLLQIHRRVALPFAPIVFALIAVPLGLRVRGNARAWAAVACGALVGGYYTLLMFGQLLALEGALPAAAAVWVPNGAFAAAGFGLLLAARRPGA